MKEKQEQHYSLAELGREYVKSRWGREGELEKLIRTASSEDRSQFLLAYIADRLFKTEEIGDMLLSMAMAVIDKRVRAQMDQFYSHMRNAFGSEIAKREAKHGKCPCTLHWNLWGDYKQQAYTSWEFREFMGGSYNITQFRQRVERPCKGSAARVEYDKWMKRRAPKKKKEESGE